jgi:hypothetical protein
MTGMTSTAGEFDPDATISIGKDKIVSLVLPDMAASIKAGSSGSPTFQYFSSLKSVDTKNVTTVGNNAFDGCINLETVNLTKVRTIGDEVFANTGTTALTVFLTLVPDSTNFTIGTDMFAGVPDKKTVTFQFPSEVNRPSSIPFSYTTNPDDHWANGFLGKGLTISTSGVTLGTGGTNTGIELILLIDDGNNGVALLHYLYRKSSPYTVTLNQITSNLNSSNERIGILNYAFWGCTSMTSVTIPNATGIIKEHAFAGCTSLETVDIPNVTWLEQDVFEGCAALEAVDFPLVTSIGDHTFAGTNLISVSLPKVTKIDTRLFEGHTKLTSVSLPKVTNISDAAFKDCTALTTLNLPEATYIGNKIFEGCTNLTSVSLPKVTNITRDAFKGCTSLTAVTFPNVNNISEAAFFGCTGLTAVTLPTVTLIGKSAFKGCTNLTSVTCQNTGSNYIDIGESAFEGCTSLSAVDLTAGFIRSNAFANTGGTTLTVILEFSCNLGTDIFAGVTVPKTVTVRFPTGMEDGLITDYNSNLAGDNWGNGFRGRGWLNHGPDAPGSIGTGTVNNNINLSLTNP